MLTYAAIGPTDGEGGDRAHRSERARRTEQRERFDRADAGERAGGEDGAERSARRERPGTRVELWCEPTQTGGSSEFAPVAERLRALAERGDVEAATVETWERYVDVSGGYPADEVPRETLDRLGQLDCWAWRHDESLPEDARTAGRGRLGPPATVRRVPRAALVEFENGVVTNVTLCDERTGCLTERLEAIAERERSETEERPRDDESRERLRS